MAKPKREKKRPKSKPTQPDLPEMPPPDPPGTSRVFPTQLLIGDQLSEPTGTWQVVGRPSASAGGKNVQVRVQRVDKPGATEIRMWAAYEKVTVMRRSTEEGKR